MSGAESWQVLYVPRTETGRPSGSGHKVFRSKIDGQIAIADWSGRYPDETDDGILYVSVQQPVVVSLSQYSAGVLAQLPVWSIRAQRIMYTLLSLPTLKAVRLHVPDLQVQLDATLAAMVQDLLQYVHVDVRVAGGSIKELAHVG